MTGPLLREATVDDLDAMAAIYAHYVEHSVATFDIVPPPVEHWAERLDVLTAARLPFLVAEDAGVVAGFAYLSARWASRSPDGCARSGTSSIVGSTS